MLKHGRWLVIIPMLLLAACQAGQAPSPGPTTFAAVPVTVIVTPPPTLEPQLSVVLLDLPVWAQAQWVYAYSEYQPAPGDPTQTITATYLFTDTVVDTQFSGGYFISHIQHQETLRQVPANWPGTRVGQPTEWWYLVAGNQIYQTYQPLDWSHIETATLTLAYDLPLATGKSWCPNRVVKGQPVADCAAAGQRTVVSQGSQATPAGQFGPCSQVAEAYNSGGVTRWLCRGIGLVAAQYDHGGTRFGFSQVLIASRRGEF